MRNVHTMWNMLNDHKMHIIAKWS